MRFLHFAKRPEKMRGSYTKPRRPERICRRRLDDAPRPAQRVLDRKADVLATLTQAGADPLFPPEVIAGLRTANVRVVDDPEVNPWEAAIELPAACRRCGSLELWQSVAGDLFGVTPGRWRCVQCDPPETVRWILALAEQIRRRHSQNAGTRQKDHHRV